MGDTVICLLPQCQHHSNNNESEMMFQSLFVKNNDFTIDVFFFFVLLFN